MVFAEYGRGNASLTPLPASEIVAGLPRHSFNHHKHPAESVRIATDLAKKAWAWRLTYDDPGEAAALLWSELAESSYETGALSQRFPASAYGLD